jgi:hypothetical protein
MDARVESGHDTECLARAVSNCYAAFTHSLASSARATNSAMAFSVASGASRCGEWRAPGNIATSTGQ